MQRFQASQGEIHYETLGDSNRPALLWVHGWGHTHANFMALAQSFPQNFNVLVDCPGFGASPPPPTPWGTEDYAKALAEFVKSTFNGKVIWIGHSFGCRVGLQIGSRYPELVSGFAFIAGAGLKPKRPPLKQLYFKSRIALFKLLKKLIPLGLSEDWLKSKFGAADYRNSSGVMRGVIVKVVNEDLSPQASAVSCPTLLIYGTQDTEAPLEMGERLNSLIKNSKLIALEGQDHYTVLSSGRHQVAPHLKAFIEGLS